MYIEPSICVLENMIEKTAETIFTHFHIYLKPKVVVLFEGHT